MNFVSGFRPPCSLTLAIAEMKIDHFLQVFMAFRFFVLLAVAGVAIFNEDGRFGLYPDKYPDLD